MGFGNAAGSFMTGFMAGYKFMDDIETKKKQQQDADDKLQLELANARATIISKVSDNNTEIDKLNTEKSKYYDELIEGTNDDAAKIAYINEKNKVIYDNLLKSKNFATSMMNNFAGTKAKIPDEILSSANIPIPDYQKMSILTSENGSKYIALEKVNADLIADQDNPLEERNYKIADNGTLQLKQTDGSFADTNTKLTPLSTITSTAVKKEKDTAYTLVNINELSEDAQAALKPFAEGGKIRLGYIEDYVKNNLKTQNVSVDQQELAARLEVLKKDPANKDKSEAELTLIAIDAMGGTKEGSLNKEVFTAYLTKVQSDPKFKDLSLAEQKIQANKLMKLDEKTEDKSSPTEITFNAALDVAKKQYPNLPYSQQVLKAEEIIALSKETGKVTAQTTAGIIGSQQSTGAIEKVLGYLPVDISNVPSSDAIKLQNYFSFISKNQNLISPESQKTLKPISAIDSTLKTMVANKGSATGMLDTLFNNIGAYTGVGKDVVKNASYNTAKTTLAQLLTKTLQGGTISNADMKIAGESLGSVWKSDAVAMGAIQETIKTQISVLESEMNNPLNNPDYMSFTYGRTLKSLKNLERAINIGSGSGRVTKQDTQKYAPPSQLFGGKAGTKKFNDPRIQEWYNKNGFNPTLFNGQIIQLMPYGQLKVIKSKGK